jgi:hypothetical protein
MYTGIVLTPLMACSFLFIESSSSFSWDLVVGQLSGTLLLNGLVAFSVNVYLHAAPLSLIYVLDLSLLHAMHLQLYSPSTAPPAWCLVCVGPSRTCWSSSLRLSSLEHHSLFSRYTAPSLRSVAYYTMRAKPSSCFG